jgi:uncharacterized repeat protein (TIGR01451 family)
VAGDYTFTAIGTDNADNTTTTVHTYSVIEAKADLAVELTAEATGVILPTLLPQVEFTATVTNLGPDDADGVQLQMTYPQGLGQPQVSPGCTLDTAQRTVTCDMGALAAGEDPGDPAASRSMTLRAGLLAFGPQTVLADVTAERPEDPAPGNNSDSHTCTAFTGLIVQC